MSLLEEIGARFRIERKNRGVTQADLARQNNVVSAYVSNMENGRIWVGWSTLQVFCKCIGIGADSLIKGISWTYTEPRQEGFC